jgi:hypothetical protein
MSFVKAKLLLEIKECQNYSCLNANLNLNLNRIISEKSSLQVFSKVKDVYDCSPKNSIR